MKTIQQNSANIVVRRGSTLVIVIALLGLLAFTGMIFLTFASQERAAAEYFSEGAKSESSEDDDPFPWALEQMLVGPNTEQKGSILWSPTQRHSISRNMIGRDLAPHTGRGMNVVFDSGTGLPGVDNDYDGSIEVIGSDPLTLNVNFVDAMAAWGGTFGQGVEGILNNRRDYNGADAIPEPDADYTYPDINSLFLGYRGWSIRDNGVGTTPRYERIEVLIPSFFRPQYLKSATGQGPNSLDVPTDPDWYDETALPVAVHEQYSARSFRPHALHIAGFDSAGTPVRRFLDANNPAHAASITALPGASGPFPLRRGEGNTWHNNSVNFGRLGVWTGDVAASPNEGEISPDVFELDSDNDGDGIREGIWMDLRYPLQEAPDGRKYAVLHSFSIYDLDGRIDLNSHGNLSGLERQWPNLTSLPGTTELTTTFLSQSNLGVGPHEINPLYALAPLTGTLDTHAAFTDWYGANPSTRLEQANMELTWLLTGRIDTTGATPAVIDGRWGDASALYYHRFTGGGRRVNSLPRPGRAGTLSNPASNLIENFGGRQGLDDNQDVLEGMSSTITGRVRGQIHPTDFAGRGTRTGTDIDANDFRSPRLSPQAGALPERWPRYLDYPVVGDASTIANDTTYIAGKDGNIATAADNLLTVTDTANASNFNPNYEDPYETMIDQDRAIRPDDQIFGIQDLITAHLTKTDQDNATGLSDRLENLAPVTFADNSDRSHFFTTLSNSFRHFAIMHDTVQREWEWTLDATDGSEYFPPQFGSILPYAVADPFRPQTRRLLLTVANQGRGVQGQLPLSLNHILDVDRNAQTPLEGTPEFLNFMRRSGLKFRPLTEHPLATETDSGGAEARSAVTSVANVVVGTPLPVFPPQNFADREFWARRDRQQLARDIYVLLYTIGGAQDNGGFVLDYTFPNSDRSRYSGDRLRLMAQFAVNVVDAMDSDNVITKFEFDKNLNDGWNLDDDAFTFSAASDPASTASTTETDLTRGGMYPDDTGDRGVVYGVEAQQIAISETLAVRSLNTGDNDATPYDDSRGGATTDPTHFLFVELQNMLPSAVQLGSGLASETVDNAVWRLVRMDRTLAADPIQTPKEGSPLPPPSHFVAFATDGLGRNSISGGGRFSLSTTTAVMPSGAAQPSSDFFADIGTFMAGAYTGPFDGTYELIAPNSPNGSMPSTASMPTDPEWAPRCDLDMLVHTTSFFQSATGILDGIGAYLGHDTTGLLNDGTLMTTEGSFASAGDGFDLVLQRRLNPDLPSITDEDQNPWVEIDRIRVDLTTFNIDSADTAVEIRSDAANDRLKNVRSTERSEPLVDVRTPHALVTTTTDAFRSNSLKGDTTTTPTDTYGANSGSSGGFNYWQPHFDREFVSSGELLTIPVFPPNLLTQKLRRATLPAYQQLGGATPLIMDISNAAAMFLWPDITPAAAAPNSATAEDNRWYRLFQFVEVPSRVNRMQGNYISLKRVPGKLNQNTLAEREVYAGLIDDIQIMSVPPLADTAGNGADDGPFSFGPDSGTGTIPDGNDGFQGIVEPIGGLSTRDRWHEFVNERDGLVNSVFDPTPLAPDSGDEESRPFWIPGAANSRPFRSLNHRRTSGTNDNGLESTLLRRLAMDKPTVVGSSRSNVAGEGGAYNTTTDPADETNRHWLEIGKRDYHRNNAGAPAATSVEHHQMLSKIMNNSTTVSNTFIVYGTAAYFEVYDDPVSGLQQIGGRMGLDVDGDSDPTNDAGWEKRAVFIFDRTELYNAYDPGSGSFDWKRLVKHRVDLSSDGK